MSKQAAKSKVQELRLVEVNGQKLTTNSLVMAEQFGRKHKNIIAKIESSFSSTEPEIIEFNRLNFKPVNYIDSKGEPRKFYQMTEEGFTEIAMSLTGEKAKLVRIKFLAEFKRLYKIITEPGRKSELQHKRDTSKPMTDMLIFVRETVGKLAPNVNHYGNEHKFCNRALTGKWKKIDESELDGYDSKLLAAIRSRNTLLMTRYPEQSDRKKPLDSFVTEYRIKHPRLMLVGNGESL